MGAPVGFEMRTFGVHFWTAFIIAFVNPPPFHVISFAANELLNGKIILVTSYLWGVHLAVQK